jgi:ElaB/YqjD/DUF883 family membrane-anchored ribosome-binding protein
MNGDFGIGTSDSAGPTKSAPELEDIEQRLKEIQAGCAKSIEATQEFVKAHPVAALGCALAVGLLLGRLTGRRS